MGAPPKAIRRAVAAFLGIENVLEKVAVINGVAFYNDTKATNVDAALKSIESFTTPVLPILGGRYKGGDFAALAPALARHGAPVIRAEPFVLVERTAGGSVRHWRVPIACW